MANVGREELLGYAADLLTAGGFEAEQAREMAELLVWANLRGVDSHGVLRIPRYIEMLAGGLVRSDAEIEEVSRHGAVCVLDAKKAPGAVAMNVAVRRAAELAESHGLGWCGVRSTSHAGAIGYFIQHLTERGLVGVGMTASKPLMAYHGAKGEVVSTNPLAIGFPQPNGLPPVVLDMSTAAVALGKIMAAKDAVRAIPIGWGIDEDGSDTTDPTKVAAVLPMAGAKGSGLSLMIEMLCSVLVGNPIIAPALTGGKSGGFNGAILAINPEAFGDREGFLANALALAQAIQGREPASDFDKVMLPGDRGHEAERVRRAQGIPLAAGTVKRLGEVANRLGVKVPAALQ